MEEKIVKIKDMNDMDRAFVNMLKEQYDGVLLKFGAYKSKAGIVYIIQAMTEESYWSCPGEMRFLNLLSFVPRGYEMVMGEFMQRFDKNQDYVIVRKSKIQWEDDNGSLCVYVEE